VQAGRQAGWCDVWLMMMEVQENLKENEVKGITQPAAVGIDYDLSNCNPSLN